MDRVLLGLRWSPCWVYLDDIISFGTTFDDALDNLTFIFERVWTTAEISKMSFVPDFGAFLRPCRWQERTRVRPQEDSGR